MLNWLYENFATIFICLILILSVVAIIIKTFGKKKDGKAAGCGCGCSNCPMSESCGNH